MKLTEVLGVVFAGGRSSRFGSDKFLHPFGGVEMGLRALKALDGIVDDLVVVGRDSIDSSWPGNSYCGPREGSGPLGALTDVFEEFPHQYILTLPCDMPLFSSLHCSKLLYGISESDVDVVVATDGVSAPQWLAAAWNAAAVRVDASVMFESGMRSVERFVETRRSTHLVFDAEVLLNLNEDRPL